MKTLIGITMRIFKIIIIGILALESVHLAHSKEREDNRNPLGCYNVGYQFVLSTLRLLPGEAGKQQSMYFLYNESNQNINLYHMLNGESSRSTYLNHTISAGRWAVLATTERMVNYACTVGDNAQQYGKIVNCSRHLRVCEYTHVKFGLNNRGNFWIVNSNSRNGAVQEVLRYGIIPAL